ncbi:MAG TPA: hypothetical protein VFC31_02620 [Candidatus Limnocylindria bacterium]|nr:hypothetical protein [Candidatus Limnocylindria bacterium]
MAYVVGLTATDGCLLSDRRAINFKSMDRDLVAAYLQLLGRSNMIREERTRIGNIAYSTQFGDAGLYRWFLMIGLTPRKSLTLGAISVPDHVLAPLVRGLLDGDGSVLNYIYQGTGKAHGTYEALRASFVSASRTHIEWLRDRLAVARGIRGSVGTQLRPDRAHDAYKLAYANRESMVLLPWLYEGDHVPCLKRKRVIWDAYRARHAGHLRLQ